MSRIELTESTHGAQLGICSLGALLRVTPKAHLRDALDYNFKHSPVYYRHFKGRCNRHGPGKSLVYKYTLITWETEY